MKVAGDLDFGINGRDFFVIDSLFLEIFRKWDLKILKLPVRKRLICLSRSHQIEYVALPRWVHFTSSFVVFTHFRFNLLLNNLLLWKESSKSSLFCSLKCWLVGYFDHLNFSRFYCEDGLLIVAPFPFIIIFNSPSNTLKNVQKITKNKDALKTDVFKCLKLLWTTLPHETFTVELQTVHQSPFSMCWVYWA